MMRTRARAPPGEIAVFDENRLLLLPVLVFDGAFNIIDRSEWRVVFKRWLVSADMAVKLKDFYVKHLDMPPTRFQQLTQSEMWRLMMEVADTNSRVPDDETDIKALTQLCAQHNRYIDLKYKGPVLGGTTASAAANHNTPGKKETTASDSTGRAASRGLEPEEEQREREL